MITEVRKTIEDLLKEADNEANKILAEIFQEESPLLANYTLGTLAKYIGEVRRGMENESADKSKEITDEKAVIGKIAGEYNPPMSCIQDLREDSRNNLQLDDILKKLNKTDTDEFLGIQVNYFLVHIDINKSIEQIFRVTSLACSPKLSHCINRVIFYADRVYRKYELVDGNCIDKDDLIKMYQELQEVVPKYRNNAAALKEAIIDIYKMPSHKNTISMLTNGINYSDDTEDTIEDVVEAFIEFRQYYPVSFKQVIQKPSSLEEMNNMGFDATYSLGDIFLQ